MSSLRWMADGIEVAERCGGVVLDKVRRVGFGEGVKVVPRSQGDMYVSGFSIESDPDPYEDE